MRIYSFAFDIDYGSEEAFYHSVSGNNITEAWDKVVNIELKNPIASIDDKGNEIPTTFKMQSDWLLDGLSVIDAYELQSNLNLKHLYHYYPLDTPPTDLGEIEKNILK